MVQHPASSGELELLPRLRSLVLTGIHGILNLYSQTLSGPFSYLQSFVTTPRLVAPGLYSDCGACNDNPEPATVFYTEPGVGKPDQKPWSGPQVMISFHAPIEFSRTFRTLLRTAGIQLSSLKCDNKAPGTILQHQTSKIILLLPEIV